MNKQKAYHVYTNPGVMLVGINHISQVLKTAVEDCVPNIKSHCSQQIPGWNEHVKDSHSIARDAFHRWLIIGKPRQGTKFVYDSSETLMKKTTTMCRLQ